MARRFAILFIVGLLVTIALTQNIVDFTYSEYDQQQGKATKIQETITIKPSKDIIQGYSFPEACSLSKSLEEVKIEDQFMIDGSNMDQMIDSLKIQFIQMLKVSEKIKKKRNNIEELSQMSGRLDNVTIVRPTELEGLKKQQQKLALLNDQIIAKSRQLQILVQDSLKNSGGNQFAISALNFQIQSLKLKLNYLRNLKLSNNPNSKTKDDFNKFFNDLKSKFDEENVLFDDLNAILQSFNQIQSLKAEIASLKGKISISDLMIQEKQACNKEKNQIQRFQKNDLEIKTHMSNLREKKKDKSNINNKYCEGVANKLLDRVKKVLQSYDYTFHCAEGLQQIIKQRLADKTALDRAEARLRQLQKNANFDQYKRKYDQNRQYIKTKQQELSKFYLAQYSHDIKEIQRLIEKAENDLDAAQQKKKKLGSSSGNKNIDYKRIQDLVYSIKKLKGTYCQDYEKYENHAQQLWKLVQKYQAEVEYSSKIRGIYQQQINELRQLQAIFDNLRSKILKRISD